MNHRPPNTAITQLADTRPVDPGRAASVFVDINAAVLGPLRAASTGIGEIPVEGGAGACNSNQAVLLARCGRAAGQLLSHEDVTAAQLRVADLVRLLNNSNQGTSHAENKNEN